MVPYANPSYTTTRDYIDEVVAPALAPYAAEHDMMAIAHEMLDFDVDAQAFVVDDEKDFWEVIYAHRLQ